MRVQIPYQWSPRDYQRPAWNALEAGAKRAILLWHRRAGKDQLGLRWTSYAAMMRVGNYWHMLPTQKQGRKVVWNAINPHTGKRVIDEVFPPEIRKRVDNTEMLIEFVNGSFWQVVGSDSIDSLVGAPPVGVVFSEFPLTNPAAYDYVRPILHENEGWAIFAYTPRGRNHGYRLFKAVEDNPDWFVSSLSIEDTKKHDGTPVIPVAAIKEDRDSGMPEELILQEYWVSFDAPMVGSYYGDLLKTARHEGRVGLYPWTPNAKVDTFWDIGVGDSTAIWFVQRIGSMIHVIDYYENTGEGIEHYAKILQERPYVYGQHFAPHDIKVREWGTGKSRAEMARALGIDFKAVPKLSLEDGIQATRALLPRVCFHVPVESKRMTTQGVERGLDGLSLYRKDWDEDKQCFTDKPHKDWTNHPADAFRYLAVALRDMYVPDAGEIEIRQETFFEVVERQRKRRHSHSEPRIA